MALAVTDVVTSHLPSLSILEHRVWFHCCYAERHHCHKVALCECHLSFWIRVLLNFMSLRTYSLSALQSCEYRLQSPAHPQHRDFLVLRLHYAQALLAYRDVCCLTVWLIRWTIRPGLIRHWLVNARHYIINLLVTKRIQACSITL